MAAWEGRVTTAVDVYTKVAALTFLLEIVIPQSITIDTHVKHSFIVMFAICCAIAPTAEARVSIPTNRTTTEQRAQLKDHILELFANYTHNPNEDNFTVFIDSLSKTYPEADTPNSFSSSTSAPFAGKTPYECSLLLKQMCEEDTNNCFDDRIFAIIDERSLRDGTLLLVEEPAEEDQGEAHSVRAVFEMAETQMLLWVAGKTTIGEAKERARETEDGILRVGMDL